MEGRDLPVSTNHRSEAPGEHARERREKLSARQLTHTQKKNRNSPRPLKK